MIHNRCWCIFCAIAACVLALFLTADESAAADAPVSFITEVAPVMKEYCFACHDSKKRSGKYDMTTFEKLLQGGTDGSPIAPGKPDESDLYTLMVTAEDRRMPPRDKGEAVPADKADVVRRWIAQGAKLDAGIDPKADLQKELRVRWLPPVPPTKYQFPTVVNALAFTPDGNRIVVGGHHELTVWTVDGRLIQRVATRAERTYALAFLNDGKLAVAGGRPGQEGDVRIYDLAAKAKTNLGKVPLLDGVSDPAVMVKHLLDVEDSVLALAVSRDGKKLAAGGCDRAVRIWDVASGAAAAKLEQTVENHADWVLAATFTTDGKHLLTASRDKTAKVWDVAAKESVLTFPEHQNTVYGVAAQPDGAVGFSVGADKLLRSWNTTGEGKQLKTVDGHTDEIFKILTHPTEPILLTSAADKTVRVWDRGKLAPLRTLTGPTDYVYALAISPDGKRVASGSFVGEIHIWTVADGKLVNAFNASPGYPTKLSGK